MSDALDREIQVYLDYLKAERGLSPHTIEAYSHDLGRYVEYLRASHVDAPAEVSAVVVSGFPQWLREQGLAQSSVGRMTVSVRGLHKFWAEEGVTADDPAQGVTPPVAGRRLPKALTLEEVDALIRVTGGDAPDPTPAQLCDWALVEVLYGTGARISEVVALTVDDATRMLSEEDMGLKLMGKGSKERIVPVGSYAREAIEAWLVRGRPQVAGLTAHPSPALFLNARGGRLSRESAFNRVKTLGRKAGIAHEISPHTLRHTYATHLIDGGADVRVVQELLGHSSVATTQIYTLVTVDHLREVYREAHPRALDPIDKH